MLTEEEINDLLLLRGQTSNVIKEFCKLAIQTIQGEVNPKIYILASNKLNVQPTQVENAVHAILSVYLKCTEKRQDKMGLCILLEPINFSEDSLTIISDIYTNNEELLLYYTNKLTVKLPDYCDLDWRLDILTKTRSLNKATDPIVTLQLKLKNEDGETDVPLQIQADPMTLTYVTSTLEDALHKSKSHHVKKLKKPKK